METVGIFYATTTALDDSNVLATIVLDDGRNLESAFKTMISRTSQLGLALIQEWMLEVFYQHFAKDM